MRVFSSPSLLAATALCTVTTSALAQDFNIDFGAAGTPIPADTYGAASGNAGVWNLVTTSSGLVDTGGAATGVSVTLVNRDITLTFNEACTAGDDQALMDDIVYGSNGTIPGSFMFTGLTDGAYTVYTYAMAPDSATFVTDVEVLGSPDGIQPVGGNFCGGFVQGVTHAVHSVDVVGGSLQVDVTVNVSFVSVNGIQLVRGSSDPGFGFCDCVSNAPCNNTGGPGEGCANSTGAGGLLTAAGSTSVGADDLTFQATQLLPNQPALLFAGLDALNGGSGFTFGDGLRCAGNGVIRLGTDAPDAMGTADWGPGLIAQGGWQPGDTRRFQGWYRNPNGSPCGNFFNLTNGYEITFTN